MEDFTTRFKKVIRKIGVQKEIAQILGVSEPTIIRYGKKDGGNPPNAAILKILIDRYNVNVNWLLTGKGKMFLNDPANPFTIQDIYPGLPANNEDFNKMLNLMARYPAAFYGIMVEFTKWEYNNREFISRLEDQES